MASPTDYQNALYYWAAINSVQFQQRCQLQFDIAAQAISAEAGTAAVNAATVSGNNTLHFAVTPSFATIGYTVTDLTSPAGIPANTVVLSTTATTVVMNQNADGTGGVGAADVIQFSPPSHTPRLALAGQLLAGQFSAQQLAMWVMQSATIQAEVVTDATHSPNPNPVGYSVNDSDIASQVSGIFTGLAMSLPSTAQSPI